MTFNDFLQIGAFSYEIRSRRPSCGQGFQLEVKHGLCMAWNEGMVGVQTLWKY